jgi:hypothetical protein
MPNRYNSQRTMGWSIIPLFLMAVMVFLAIGYLVFPTRTAGPVVSQPNPVITPDTSPGTRTQ